MQVQVAEGVDCGITLAPPYANPYNCDPSPLNEPDIVDPVTYNDPVITAEPENGNPTPEPPPPPFKAYDAVKAYDDDTAFRTYDAVVAKSAREADTALDDDTAFRTYDAVCAVTIYDAVATDIDDV